MTRYLLDTDALIDFSKGVEPAMSSILSLLHGEDAVATCPVSVTEFYAGLDSEQVSHREAFIAALPCLPVNVEAAMKAGQDRYSYARSGQTISTTDALIAAVAREKGAILVTGNVKHFPMKDVPLISLR